MNWRRRLNQWLAALRRAHGAGVPIPWFKMLRGILTPVPREVWRERIRTCRTCVLFDAEHCICNGTVGPLKSWGCQCYLPFKCLSPAPYEGADYHVGCWGRAKFGDDFGWGEYIFPSRWQVLTAFVRFLAKR